MYDNIVQCGSDIVKILRTDGLNKNSIKRINNTFQKSIESIGNELKFQDITINNDELKNNDPGKVKAAVFLFINTFICQIIISTVLIIFFGSVVGTNLLAIIVAPISEEISKSIAIKGGYIIEFNIILNSYEIINYVSNGTMSGLPLIKMIKARIRCSLMHITTSIIQWITSNTSLLKLNDENKDEVSFIGQLLGTLIHMVWNILALTSQKFTELVFR